MIISYIFSTMGMIVMMMTKHMLVPEDQVHQKVQEKFPSLDLLEEDLPKVTMKIANWNIQGETPEEIASN